MEHVCVFCYNCFCSDDKYYIFISQATVYLHALKEISALARLYMINAKVLGKLRFLKL